MSPDQSGTFPPHDAWVESWGVHPPLTTLGKIGVMVLPLALNRSTWMSGIVNSPTKTICDHRLVVLVGGG